MNEFNNIIKSYKEIKNKLIPLKNECPKENLLWDYIQGDLLEKEIEQIDGHLFSCAECLESLRAIQILHQAQNSPCDMPEYLYNNTKELIQKTLNGQGLQPMNKPVQLTLALIWDKVCNKVSQLKPDIGRTIIAPLPKFQPIRKAGKNNEDIKTLPYVKAIEVNEGIIIIEIDSSDKENFLAIKTTLQSHSKKTTTEIKKIRVILYRSKKMCASIYLNQDGIAIFNRIKEGEYSLEILAGDKSLGVIELSVQPSSK
ncbi:MAG: zf-HC2 domain-containing protein [bacterium]